MTERVVVVFVDMGPVSQGDVGRVQLGATTVPLVRTARLLPAHRHRPDRRRPRLFVQGALSVMWPALTAMATYLFLCQSME
ncbi:MULTISPECIES: hypothetical protein [Streptosporangium]|uniref:Uncharacterized protein n=1 Tax=Streptosporangium brasiliense TaxID=47480 RepID=A0ABT9RJG0_9ACTN|nr:hypothetical protein [Streptosporangium brasiliense]MDP9868849.1 hypothetical protein [Streptosporangium brasiliense]